MRIGHEHCKHAFICVGVEHSKPLTSLKQSRFVYDRGTHNSFALLSIEMYQLNDDDVNKTQANCKCAFERSNTNNFHFDMKRVIATTHMH